MHRAKRWLYNILINKNPSIKEAYWRFCKRNLRIYKNYKLLCFLYLFILNIKAFFKYKISYGELPIPEYQVSRYDYTEILEQIESVNTVSFDFINTLVFRTPYEDYDFFRLIALKNGVANFARIRENAQNKKENVNIIDIYGNIAYKGYCSNIGKCIEAEQEILRKCIYINPFIKNIYDRAVDLGKKIIVICQTVYQEEFIKQILKDVGYTQISDVYIIDKTYIASYIKIKQQNNSIIHIGSDYQLDYINTLRAGIRAVYYSNINEQGNHFRDIGSKSLPTSIYKSIVNAKLHNGINECYNLQYEFGYAYCAFICYSYCQWIEDLASREKLDLLLFTSRDSKMFFDIYNRYLGNVKSAYIYCSRSAVRRADFPDNIDLFYETFFRVRKNKTTIGDCFINAGLDNFLDKIELEGINKFELLTEKNENTVLDIIIKNKDTIKRIYEPEYIIANNYFNHIAGECKKICIIDLGWRGTSITFFDKIFKNGGKKVVGTVIGAINDEIANSLLESGRLFSYVFSNFFNNDMQVDRKGVMLLETIFSTNTPSLISYKKTEGTINQPFEFNSKYEYKNTCVDEIHRGIMDFCEDYYNLSKILPASLIANGREAFMPLYKILNNKQYILNVLKYAYNSDIAGENEQSLIDLIEDVKKL